MNLNDPNLLNTASNVALSIQVALNPQSPLDERQKATIFCENFRSTSSPLDLAAVGFILVSKFQQSHVNNDDSMLLITSQLALVGFQFIEDVIKFNWSKFSERERVKENVIHLLKPSGGFFNDATPPFLREAVARVVVEIAKKEWPQLWPNLLPSLFELMSVSDLPLLILRRLAEDVITLQSVDTVNRRRDLTQSLNVTAEEVLSTLYLALSSSLAEFQNGRMEKVKRRIKIILETLLPYIEWSKLSYFLSGNRIPVLFTLLETVEFRMEASECIIQFLEKNVHKKDDRHDITNVCLKVESFGHFINAVTNCAQEDEEPLRKLGEILKGICSCSPIGNMDIKKLLSGLTVMASRPEAFAVLSCTSAINSFLKNVSIENTATLQEDLIGLLNIIMTKYISISPATVEKSELLQFKSELSQMLRKVGQLFQFQLYNIISIWLRNCLSNPSVVESFQWDTLILVLGTVQSFVTHENEELLKIGLQDLELCHTKFILESNLKIKSSLLSTISAEFVFLALSHKRNSFTANHTALLNSILEGVFNCFLLDSETGGEIRHHAAALMIKLASDFPELLSPTFDVIFAATSKIFPALSTIEYQCLAESMLLISNSWNDTVRQSSLIESLVNQQEWKLISAASKNLQSLFEIFKDENVFLKEKNLFLRNLHVCYCILKRVKVNNQDIPQLHPAYQHFVPIIPAVLEFTKAIHSLIELPQLKFSVEYDDSEMSQILGITNFSSNCNSPENKKTVEQNSLHEKIKTFFRSTFDSAYGILRLSSSLFTPQLYTIPQIGTMFLHYVGGNSKSFDDYRLCNILRFVFKQFLVSCPTSQAELIVKPFLQSFLPFMLNRLQTRWTEIGTVKFDADSGQIKEVLDNASIRLLTKEYFELLVRLLEHSRGGSQRPPSEEPDSSQTLKYRNGEMEIDDYNKVNENSISKKTNSQSSNTKLSCGEVGLILLQDPICSKVIYHSCLISLTWEDNLVHLKAGRCLQLCWDAIAKEPEIVHAVLIECLRALTTLSDKETKDILHKLVDTICVAFLGSDPTVKMIFLEWGATEDSLTTLWKHCQAPKNEKRRKDMLRKLIENNPRFEQKKVDTKWLENLPKLVIYNPMKNQNAGTNLNDCSSAIHS